MRWTHPDFDGFKKVPFLGFGRREIQKLDFPELEQNNEGC